MTAGPTNQKALRYYQGRGREYLCDALRGIGEGKQHLQAVDRGQLDATLKELALDTQPIYFIMKYVTQAIYLCQPDLSAEDKVRIELVCAVSDRHFSMQSKYFRAALANDPCTKENFRTVLNNLAQKYSKGLAILEFAGATAPIGCVRRASQGGPRDSTASR